MPYPVRLTAILLIAAAASHATDTVTVAQTTVTLKTWAEGPPDENPYMELFPSYNPILYPYTWRDNFTSNTSDVSWRELTLENEYLFCRVLPDLGGHLYSCLDKINNTEMFYANPVVRKGYVGLRGAWVAMGIELNFPVGHSMVTVSPISFGTDTRPDGSAGVWVADRDRQTGMEWRVEFVLHPGSTALEQDVWLYNPGESRQPYYFWSDAELILADLNDTFEFPTNIIGTHGFTFLDSWPISQMGVDQRILNNYPIGQGLFSYGSNEPFHAAYHPSTKTATVHYADPAAVPGKKLWTWGTTGTGDNAYYESILTENYYPSFEIQSGTTPNQETRLWLNPQGGQSFTEYWMPARGLDGITRANLNGVLYLGRTTSNSQPALMVEFNPNEAISGATVEILNGSTAVYQEPVSLTPAVTYSRTVTGIVNNATYTFELLDSTGAALMSHTENQYDALPSSGVTLGNQPPPDLTSISSEQDFLFQTSYYEQYAEYVEAESAYNQGLELFPNSVALRKGSGRLAYLSARYDDAATLLGQAAAQDPSDHETQYYLGLAYAALGRTSSAMNELTGITSTTDFGAAASLELACLNAASGNQPAALSLLQTVNTVRSAGMQAAILRHQNATAQASSLVAQWRASDPTDLLLRSEATLLGTPDATLSSDLGAEPERVLNIVEDYMRLGFYADAITLLTATYPDVPENQREPGSVTPQNHPLIAYYRGYCRQQLGQSAMADYAAASAMSSLYIFPSRDSSFAVLRAAIQANASDATAHYLLGLLYISRRQVDNAISEWEAARAVNPSLPTLLRDLGRAYLDMKDDPTTALPILAAGLQLDPSNSDMNSAYSEAQNKTQTLSACSLTLTSPSTVALSAAASQFTVSFTGSSTCAWFGVGYGGWITATTTASGSGSGSITYAVAANSGLSSRTQTLIVAGHPINVTQAAASCSYSLTSTSASPPAAGTSFTVGVNFPSDACSWSASSPSSWASVTSSGATVNITVAANRGLPRNTTLTIAGQPFTITQDGAATGPTGLGFYTLTPCRIVDTRTGQNKTGAFGPPAVTGQATRDFPLSGACGIPATAQAYSLNFTAVPQGPLAWLSVWPSGDAYPNVSTLNTPDGSIIANAAIVPAGANGSVTVLTAETTDLIIDTNGYFAAPDGQELAFYTLPPCRIADTRMGQSKTGAFGPPSLAAQTSRDFPIQSSDCNIPPTAQAYSLNFTAVPSGPLPWLSAWPAGEAYPNVSTLNSPKGTTLANAAIVPKGSNGAITVLPGAATDLIVDINGYFAPPISGALHFYPVTPCRVADTRRSQGKPDPFGPPSLAASLTRDFPIQSSPCGIPPTAAAYALNITVVPQGPLQFLSIWPSGEPYPNVSTLNSTDGSTLANAAIVPAGVNGAITVLAGNPTDLIIDINGYFAP